MIFILLYWIYIALLFFTLGNATERRLLFALNPSPAIELKFARKIIIGIATLLFSLSVIHFIFPINGYVHLIILLILTTEVWVYREEYKFFMKTISFQLKQTSFTILIPCILLVLFFSYIATDLPLYNLDEGRYHFQALLWSKEYKIIPGLANLHARLGSNSSWYLLNAFFDVGFFNKKVFHIINPLMLLFILLYCIRQMGNLFIKFDFHALTAFFIFLYISFNFNFFRYWYINGITPDMGVQFFAITIALYITYLISNNHEKGTMLFQNTVVLIICCSALLSRISGIASFILYSSIIPIAFNRKIDPKYIASSLLILSFFFLVLFARNIILSGYIIFPFKHLDYLLVDWKFPAYCLAQVEDSFSNHQLHAFTKNNFQYSSTFSYQRLHDLLQMLYGKNLLAFGQFTINLCCLPFIIINFFINRKRWILNSASLLLFLIFYILSGGVYRFGAGYFCIAAIIPISIFFETIFNHIHLKEKKFQFFKIITTIFTYLFLLFYIVMPSSPVSVKENKLFYPIELIKEARNNLFALNTVPSSTFKQYTQNNLTINIPEYHIYDHARLNTWFSNRSDSCRNLDPIIIQCKGSDNCEYRNAFESKMNWMNPLPSVGAIYEGTRLRGNTLEQGFYISK